MKRRHIFLNNVIFIALILFSAGTVYQFFTGVKPLSIVSSLRDNRKTTIITNTCRNDEPIAGLANARVSSLRKLGLYQQACHSFATGTVMTFISMPSTNEEAVRYAKENADTLKEFARYNVRPLIIMEPTNTEGNLLDIELFANGTYTPIIDAYFAQLKAEGITDKQLGIWNPFPEANLPYWTNNKPENVSAAIAANLTTAQKYFPDIVTSVLLNSATYESTDFNWQNGDYISLIPYVKSIPAGLIDYAGIQGFPWVSRQQDGGIIFNAAEYLNPPLVTELADYLKTKKVWFNTGTFGAKYTLDTSQQKSIAPEQRKEILKTVHQQVAQLQKNNYEVAVNIFAEDKSDDAEETDWSYWSDGLPFSSNATPVITGFISEMHSKKVEVWLFDK